MTLLRYSTRSHTLLQGVLQVTWPSSGHGLLQPPVGTVQLHRVIGHGVVHVFVSRCSDGIRQLDVSGRRHANLHVVGVERRGAAFRVELGRCRRPAGCGSQPRYRGANWSRACYRRLWPANDVDRAHYRRLHEGQLQLGCAGQSVDNEVVETCRWRWPQSSAIGRHRRRWNAAGPTAGRELRAVGGWSGSTAQPDSRQQHWGRKRCHRNRWP